MKRKIIIISSALALLLAVGTVVLISNNSSTPISGSASACSCQAGAANGSRIDLSGYSTPDNIAIVVANTANSPCPVLSDAGTTLVKGLMENEALPTLWSASGQPNQIQVSLQPISGKNTARKNQTRIDNNINLINKAIQASPSNAGMSLFEGIGTAIDELKSQASHDPWIILVGSGLDDTGPLNTTTGILAETPDQIAQRVAQANPGFSLAGVTILATSLGYAAPPQDLASSAQRQLISEMWLTVLNRLGASVILDPQPAPACSVVTDQPVTPSELPDITVSCTEHVVTYELPSALLFDGDSSILQNGTTDLLAEPIRILTENPLTTVTIIGHTASISYQTGDSMRLSIARAEAVAAVLRQAGIPDGRITVRGVGDTDPKHEDLNPDGSQNQYAAGERRVDLFISGVTSCPSK